MAVTIWIRACAAAVAAAAVALTGTGCGRTETAPAPTTSTTAEKTALTIKDYIKEKSITEVAVKRSDPGAPKVFLPYPPGWVDAGSHTPEWSYGAILFAKPKDPNNPPNVIAVMEKLTGDVDPAKIVEYAPGEMKNQVGFTPVGEPRRLTVSGFNAAQSAGTYIKNTMKRAIIQTTVAIPVKDGVYVLQMNADAPDGDVAVLTEAMKAIDANTKITV